MGSVSKTLTATLAAYAETQGKLSLTDSPTRHLPELKGSALEAVSLINLATHTAGGFPLQLPDETDTEQRLTDYFRTWRPEHAIGRYRTYANPSIGLLGRASAASFGLSYTAAMQTQLLPKLGMTGTFFDIPAEDVPRYAQGYNQNGEPVRLNPALLAEEAYDVKTSSEDLLRFVDAQLGVVETDEAVSQAIAATQVGYYRIGAMTQALIWEQYPIQQSWRICWQATAGRWRWKASPSNSSHRPYRLRPTYGSTRPVRPMDSVPMWHSYRPGRSASWSWPTGIIRTRIG